MKKLIAISAMLLVILSASGVSYASSAADPVGVLLTVGPTFTFAIGEAVVDMGTVAVGASGGGGVVMWCATNQGNPWTVLVQSTTIDGLPGNQIPLSNFLFNTYALADGGGVDSAGTFVGTPTVLTQIDQLAYTAAASEYSDTDVRVGMYLSLNVPWDQTADTYAATVTATMTE